MGICGANTPEVYTNLLFEEVATWVRDVSEPWRETSVCNQDGEDTPSAVSQLKSYLKSLFGSLVVTQYNILILWASQGWSQITLIWIIFAFFFQPWEDSCQCGRGEIEEGIAQIYQEEENSIFSTLFSKPGFKLKIPLCLGALISNTHVLTTKLCFGEYLTDVQAVMPYHQKGRCHSM